MHLIGQDGSWGILWPLIGFVFSLPAIGGLIAKAAPFVSSLLGRAAPAAAPAAPIVRQLAPVAGRMLAPIGRAIRSPIGRAVTVGGAIGVGQEAAQRGLRITINRRTGQQEVRRVRRMNPTNVRALRRAVRRARSFQRVARKVERLFPRQRSRFLMRAPRRRRYRGDILPFEHDGRINPYAAEDYADYLDEMEDLGYDPGSFLEDAEEGD